MKQKVIHGGSIDAVTSKELEAAFAGVAGRGVPELTIIRTAESVVLDATGAGDDSIYKVPLGMRFKLRRISLNLGSATDPSTGNVALNVAGKFVALYASDQFLEYVNPSSPAGIPSIPGVQTWSEDEGPHFTNGQVVRVKTLGLTVNQNLSVQIQGLLYDETPSRGGGRA